MTNVSQPVLASALTSVLDTSAFALLGSDPPDPIPVPYILTLQTNLSFGRMGTFLQHIILEFGYKSELADCML